MMVSKSRSATSPHPMCSGMPVIVTFGSEVHAGGMLRRRGNLRGALASAGRECARSREQCTHRESTARRRAPRCARRLESRSVHGLEPVVNVLAHLVLRDAVTLL